MSYQYPEPMKPMQWLALAGALLALGYVFHQLF